MIHYRIVEDRHSCFAVDVHHCATLDLLTEYAAPELTPLYCKTDDWLAEALPKVRWLRIQSLDLGGDSCNFRWYRVGKR